MTHTNTTHTVMNVNKPVESAHTHFQLESGPSDFKLANITILFMFSFSIRIAGTHR